MPRGCDTKWGSVSAQCKIKNHDILGGSSGEEREGGGVISIFHAVQFDDGLNCGWLKTRKVTFFSNINGVRLDPQRNFPSHNFPETSSPTAISSTTNIPNNNFPNY